MIPKIIHYCWFGNTPLPPTAHKCLESWEKYFPDYEIVLWNEDNSPMEIPFVRDAYKAKKYAFVADYVRMWAVYTYGGIYMDTDMLVIRPMEKLLEKLELFFGYEDPERKYINAAIFGAVKSSCFISDILSKYNDIQFSLDKIHQITIPNIVTGIYDTKKVYQDKVLIFNYESLSITTEKETGLRLYEICYTAYLCYSFVGCKLANIKRENILSLEKNLFWEI